jgi:hypothetical protein
VQAVLGRRAGVAAGGAAPAGQITGRPLYILLMLRGRTVCQAGLPTADGGDGGV